LGFVLAIGGIVLAVGIGMLIAFLTKA
jgi:hypothetical protein